MAADDVHRLWVRIFERASQLPGSRREASNLETYARVCQIEIEKFLT
jgi:hypothetical protein